MEQQIEALRQQKQGYIVANIDPNYYEEFHQFCTQEAGQIDIDGWSYEYVQQLVTKFKDEMIREAQQEPQHERSFAIYQTTSGEGPVAGSLKVDMNDILAELEEKPRTAKTPDPPKKKDQPAPRETTHTPEIKANSKPFAKKQPQSDGRDKRQQPNKISPVALLDSVMDQPKAEEKPKAEQSINRSFFDTSNFWETPKVDSPNPKKTPSQPVIQQFKKQFQSNKYPTNSKPSAPTYTIKQVTAKKQELPKKPTQNQTNNFKSKGSPFDEYFTGTNTPRMKQEAPVNFSKSQFDTFSAVAEEEIKKKRTSTIAQPATVPSSPTNIKPGTAPTNRPKANSTIVLKQVREYKPSSTASIEQSSVISTKTKNTVKQPYRGPRVFNNDFVDSVSCIPCNVRASLGSKQLRVEVREYEIIHRSIFAADYLMYNIKVYPLQVSCKRNYQDFTKLKSTLEKYYPGIQLPYLEKQGWRPDTSDDYARKQGQMLEYFIADVLAQPELRNSRITEEFLTIPDHKKIKRNFERYLGITGGDKSSQMSGFANIKAIEELCLMSGKVEVALTEKERVYNDNMGKLIVKLELNLDKFRRNCESLSQIYSQAMATMLSIDENAKDIQKDLEQFNKSVSIKEIDNLEGSLKKIRDNYKENYIRMKFEKTIIEDEVLPFLRYQKQNVHVSKEILECCNNLTSRYLRRSQSEALRPNESYMAKQYAQFKQGVLEESKSILVLKYQAGFMQAQASSEMQRIMVRLGDKISTLWGKIGAKYVDQLNKSVNLWRLIS